MLELTQISAERQFYNRGTKLRPLKINACRNMI